MADLWTQEFCLGCDKQTEGTAYCSESCRLADSEKTSMPGSVASSPGLANPSYPWTESSSASAAAVTTTPSQRQHGLFLTPAIDFSNPQPFGSSRNLATSCSNSSLSSLNTLASSTEASQLCEKTRQELQGYAAFFDNARLARRRSY